MSKYSFVDLQ